MTYLVCKYVLFKAHIVCIIGKGAFFNYVDKIFFWSPTPLRWHFLPNKSWQKVKIFGLPTHLFLST